MSSYNNNVTNNGTTKMKLEDMIEQAQQWGGRCEFIRPYLGNLSKKQLKELADALDKEYTKAEEAGEVHKQWCIAELEGEVDAALHP